MLTLLFAAPLAFAGGAPGAGTAQPLSLHPENPHPAVSIFNFHYASPPDTVALNYSLNKVIGDNETGFKGTGDRHYRMEAWEFLLAGGGLYNNLDYSFTCGHEDGTFAYPPTQPGGGTAALRRQLRILRAFLHRFDFTRMKPDNSVLRGGIPESSRARVLCEPGNVYAIYVTPPLQNGEKGGARKVELKLEIPAGRYRVEWLDPANGSETVEGVAHEGGTLAVSSPALTEDIALSIRRSEAPSGA